MKRILFILLAFALLAGTAMAGVQGYSERPTILISETLTLTANASAVALHERLAGGYLYAVEIYSTGDDAMTFTINSELGTQLFTMTTTAATSGEIKQPTAFWPIVYGTTPTYTLTGFSGTTVTIVVTVVKK